MSAYAKFKSAKCWIFVRPCTCLPTESQCTQSLQQLPAALWLSTPRTAKIKDASVSALTPVELLGPAHCHSSCFGLAIRGHFGSIRSEASVVRPRLELIRKELVKTPKIPVLSQSGGRFWTSILGQIPFYILSIQILYWSPVNRVKWAVWNFRLPGGAVWLKHTQVLMRLCTHRLPHLLLSVACSSLLSFTLLQASQCREVKTSK